MSDQTILVIEDDPDLQAWLAVHLQQAGFGVALAHDGTSAVMMARERTPDAIVLDVGLPGEDGFQVLERLRAAVHLTDTPIVAITGSHPEITEQQAIDAGASAFFMKPVDPDDLRTTLAELLGSA